MEPQYVSFENGFVQGPAELGPDIPALACTSVDGFPADEDGQGTVICDVWMLQDRRFLVDWHDNGYRTHPSVLELIEDAKCRMAEAY